MLWLPPLAQAHAGGADAGLIDGLLHPVFGIDHLLAMVSVGIVSAQRGGTDLWRLPAVFVLAMIGGGLWGRYAVSTAWVEIGIAVSLVALGACIAVWPKRLPLAFAVSGVALFGACHGMAHGAEMPRAAHALFYSVGFVLSSSLLHICGLVLGEVATMRRALTIVLRVAAAGVWTMGVVLLLPH